MTSHTVLQYACCKIIMVYIIVYFIECDCKQSYTRHSLYSKALSQPKGSNLATPGVTQKASLYLENKWDKSTTSGVEPLAVRIW